jgi:uncharacterized protein YbbK (DUF523 family)
MKIVSACLSGVNCRWNGKNSINEKIKKMVENGEAIAFCPEVLGGLSIPRKSCGIHGGIGIDVIENRAKVRTTKKGEDVTKQFLKGAEEILRIVKSNDIKEAILRTPSPSCGCGKTWQLDKNFRNHVVDGDDVTTALLKKNEIKVYTEENFN